MDKKWRDSLDVAAAKPMMIDYSGEFKRMMDDPKKGKFERPPKKGQVQSAQMKLSGRQKKLQKVLEKVLKSSKNPIYL